MPPHLEWIVCCPIVFAAQRRHWLEECSVRRLCNWWSNWTQRYSTRPPSSAARSTKWLCFWQFFSLSLSLFCSWSKSRSPGMWRIRCFLCCHWVLFALSGASLWGGKKKTKNFVSGDECHDKCHAVNIYPYVEDCCKGRRDDFSGTNLFFCVQWWLMERNVCPFIFSFPSFTSVFCGKFIQTDHFHVEISKNHCGWSCDKGHSESQWFQIRLGTRDQAERDLCPRVKLVSLGCVWFAFKLFRK